MVSLRAPAQLGNIPTPLLRHIFASPGNLRFPLSSLQKRHIQPERYTTAGRRRYVAASLYPTRTGYNDRTPQRSIVNRRERSLPRGPCGLQQRTSRGKTGHPRRKSHLQRPETPLPRQQKAGRRNQHRNQNRLTPSPTGPAPPARRFPKTRQSPFLSLRRVFFCLQPRSESRRRRSEPRRRRSEHRLHLTRHLRGNYLSTKLKTAKANKDAGSGAVSLPFSPYSPSRWIFSSRII
jgi:hypothetical protein